MKLESFRELLIKKSGDVALENIITFVRDDLLADLVIESLEKAKASHKGDSAGIPISDFGKEMSPRTEPNLIRDALGHHASHYLSASKAGDKETANKHANQLFRIMDMAEQAKKYSSGKLDVQAPSPHPWERNGKPHTFNDAVKQPLEWEGKQDKEDKVGLNGPQAPEARTLENFALHAKERLQNKHLSDQHKEAINNWLDWYKGTPVGKGNKKGDKFVTDTKGWRYRGNKNNGFEFLQQPPHEAYAVENRNQNHSGPYPFEKIKINGEPIQLRDIPADQLHENETHPFDRHPIMSEFEIPSGSRTHEQDMNWRLNHMKIGQDPAFKQKVAEIQARKNKG